jgi:hypothetical protein
LLRHERVNGYFVEIVDQSARTLASSPGAALEL